MTLPITVTLFGFGFAVLGVVHNAVSSTTTAMESTNETNGCANSNWTAENQSCYLHVQEGMSFRQANESCKTRGANLVSISSDEENQFILQYVRNYLPVWIGLFRATKEACAGAVCLNWMWLDGSQAAYTNWKMALNTTGQCVFMTAKGVWWHGDLCSSPYDYVCEKKRIFPTTTSEPTTIMSGSEMTTLSDTADNVAPTTNSSQENNEENKMPVIIGCVVSGLVVSGIIIVAVVVLVKRHRKNKIAQPKGSFQHHHPLSCRNSSKSDKLTRDLDRKSPKRVSPKRTEEQMSSQRDKLKRDQERKSQQRDKPRKVKDKKPSTKDQPKNHNNDDSTLKGTTGNNLGYCHEDLELGSTNKVSKLSTTNPATSAHGEGCNPEPVYAAPIKKKHRPRSEGVEVQENSLYASGK